MKRSPSLWLLDMLLYDQNIIGASSEIFGNLRKISGKCSETFALPSEQFWKIFGKWSEIRILHARLWIWFLSSRLQLDISFVHCAHSWGIELNTRRGGWIGLCKSADPIKLMAEYIDPLKNSTKSESANCLPRSWHAILGDPWAVSGGRKNFSSAEFFFSPVKTFSRPHWLTAPGSQTCQRMMIRAIQSDFVQLLELPSAILCNQRLYRETYLAQQTLGHTQFRSFTTFFVVSESAWQRSSFFCMKSSPWLRRCKRIQHILSFSTPWHWPLLIFTLQHNLGNWKENAWKKSGNRQLVTTDRVEPVSVAAFQETAAKGSYFSQSLSDYFNSSHFVHCVTHKRDKVKILGNVEIHDPNFVTTRIQNPGPKTG